MSSENPIQLTNMDVEPAAVVSLPRRKAPIILASAMAVSLVTAVGIVVGLKLLSAAGDPAERMPASVAVFASVDLTPSRDQVRRLKKLADPQASVEKLLSELEAKPDLSGWTGPGVAAGIWLDKNERPFVLISLESRDDAAATKGLANLRSKQDIGFVVRGGQVLIAAGEKAADSQAAAEAAWAESEKSPLSHHARYTDARKWLSDEQLAVFYVDLTALDQVMDKVMQEALKTMMGDIPELGAGETSASAFASDPLTTGLEGSLIAGVRVEDDGYLVRFRNIGGKEQTGTVADALARLGALPSASDVAVVAHISGESGSALPMLPLLFGGLGTFDGAGDQTIDNDPSMIGSLTEAEFKEFSELSGKPESKLTPAERKRLEELTAKLIEGGMTDPPGDLTGPSDPFADLSESFTGATVAVAVSGIAETPVFRALIELAKDPEADLKSRLQAEQGKDVTVEVNGRAVTVTSAAFRPDGQKLADDPLYQRALAGCPAAAQVALYANAIKVLPAEVRDKIGQVRAIGLCQSVDKGESTGSIRVLVA